MKFSLPDWISLLRIPLAILFLLFINNKTISFIILLLVVISDILDGFLARKLKVVSKLGSTLDPLADKIFIVGVFIMYVVINKIFVWEFFLLIIRDIYSVTEIVTIAVTKTTKTHMANVWGKITTALQFIMIAIIIFEISSLFIPFFIAIIISSVITIFTYARKRWFN